MATKIDTVTARSKLEVQREPYWHRISKGCYVGYRKMSNDFAGTWRVRFRNEDGAQAGTSLGTLEEYPHHERFDKAVIAAREWISLASTGGAIKVVTVLDACNEYVAFIREKKGDNPADDLAYRYRRWVAGDPICDIELLKLSRSDMDAFRRRLAASPVRTGKGGVSRERSKDTVNRDMAPVRAALNHAMDNRAVSSDFAWRQPLKAFKNVSKRRTLYLDYSQRRALVENAPDDLAKFLRGLAMIPMRPGALAALTRNDFDDRLNVLFIGKDKTGQDRKIMLPPEVAALFSGETEKIEGTSPLLTRSDGLAWNKDSWKGPIKDAAQKAGLPAATTAYTLRHSVITDLVHGGLDLLTVAQMSGTSVAMIEKHYGHLRGTVAASALARLVL